MANARPERAEGPAVRQDEPAPDSPVETLEGVGPERARRLAACGIRSLRDLAEHLPLRYEDWSSRTSFAELTDGATAVVEGKLAGFKEQASRFGPRRKIAGAWLVDEDRAALRLVWFNLRPYMRLRFAEGTRVVARGRVQRDRTGRLEMVHPELRAADNGGPGRWRAVYRLAAGIGQNLHSKLVGAALAALGDRLEGALPQELRRRAGLPPFAQALGELHFPPLAADCRTLELGRTPAHQAIALDEMFAFQVALGLDRLKAARRRALPVAAPGRLSAEFLARLPFNLTAAQHRVIADIAADLGREQRMNRMLVGDVGSGKTVVALWAALRAVESGLQAVVMTPSELLAEQHYGLFRRLCDPRAVPGALLSAAVNDGTRRRVLAGLRDGTLKLVFGTQALIQQQVRMRNLGLAVIDEQHRFGVFDRARLATLGPGAHVLLLTATPIPRSLALVLFANVDVSFLDEMPAGRCAVTTEVVAEQALEQVHELVRDQLAAGAKAYYVLPRIEAEREDEAPRAAAQFAAQLRAGPLQRFPVELLHGRMRAAEKEGAMRRFRDGAARVLVATTVVEVGIDVPEATVMVVLAAERYGLAQLHQLRGRVGRSTRRSFCFLVFSPECDPQALKRLAVLVCHAAGREVAEADLTLRGPGDLLGARQSGVMPLRFARFIARTEQIAQARAWAEQWLARDPELSAAQSRGLRQAVQRMLGRGFSLSDVG